MAASLFFLLPQIISVTLLSGVLIYIKKQKRTSLIVSFIYLAMNLLLWSGSSIMEVLATSESATITWGSTSYLFVALLPILLLIFILRFLEKDELLTKRNIALLSIIPLIAILMAFTHNQLFFKTVSVKILSQGVTAMSSTRGPFFWVFTAYSYTLIAVSVVLLINALRKTSKLERKQIIMLLAGIMVPFLGNIVYIFNLSLTEQTIPYDLTTLSFSITAVLFVIAFRFYRFLNIVPVARSTIFNELTDAIIIVDKEGDIVDVNKAAIKLLTICGHKSKEEVIGSDFETIFKSVPVNLKKEVSFECDKRGVPEFFITEITPLKQEGALIGKVVTIKDVTKIKRVEQARKITELRNQFLNRITHELRQPLFPIIGYASEALENSRSKKIKEQLTKVVDNAEHLRDIVDKTISLISFQTGRDLRLTETNLKELINSVLTEHQKDWQEKKLSKNLSDCNIMIDESFSQVIYNLIDNAFKYGGEKISISLKKEGKKCVFSVEDDGKGISTVDLKKIKQGLYLAEEDPSKLRKGFGMGLALVKLIVDAHKGELKLENTKNGFKAIINLPLGSQVI